MAIKYFLNQSGLNQLLDDISDNDTSQSNTSNNITVFANPETFSSDTQQLTSIDINSYINEVQNENGKIDFVLTNSVNNINTIYHFCGELENLIALQTITPIINDSYKIKDIGLYVVWTGVEWEQFGIISNFNSNIVKENIQTIPSTSLNKILYEYKPIIVTNLNEFIDALSSAQDVMIIDVNAGFNLPSTITIPARKKVTINLNGNTLTADNTAFNINNSQVTFANGGAIINNVNDTIIVSNNGVVNINGADITSPRNGITVKNRATTVMNDGSITSQEAGILGLKDSTIIVNGGTITGIDNGPLMGNGSPAGSANDGTNCNIIMNDGTLIAHIQTTGYIACGAYIPNSGSFTMNGGTIISDGCGICIRGGQINLNGGSITAAGESGIKGKVGDSPTMVSSCAIVYDAQSRYPAMDSLELNIASGMQLQGTDGDIEYILEDGIEANVNDNR